MAAETDPLRATPKPRGRSTFPDLPPGALDDTHVRVMLAVRAGNRALDDIAKAVGLNRQTTHRYITDLRQAGILGPPPGVVSQGAIHCLYGLVPA
jgi:predicted transcriptional regulator